MLLSKIISTYYPRLRKKNVFKIQLVPLGKHSAVIITTNQKMPDGKKIAVCSEIHTHTSLNKLSEENAEFLLVKPCGTSSINQALNGYRTS